MATATSSTATPKKLSGVARAIFRSLLRWNRQQADLAGDFTIDVKALGIQPLLQSFPANGIHTQIRAANGDRDGGQRMAVLQQLQQLQHLELHGSEEVQAAIYDCFRNSGALIAAYQAHSAIATTTTTSTSYPRDSTNKRNARPLSPISSSVHDKYTKTGEGPAILMMSENDLIDLGFEVLRELNNKSAWIAENIAHGREVSLEDTHSHAVFRVGQVVRNTVDRFRAVVVGWRIVADTSNDDVDGAEVGDRAMHDSHTEDGRKSAKPATKKYRQELEILADSIDLSELPGRSVVRMETFSWVDSANFVEVDEEFMKRVDNQEIQDYFVRFDARLGRYIPKPDIFCRYPRDFESVLGPPKEEVKREEEGAARVLAAGASARVQNAVYNFSAELEGMLSHYLPLYAPSEDSTIVGTAQTGTVSEENVPNALGFSDEDRRLCGEILDDLAEELSRIRSLQALSSASKSFENKAQYNGNAMLETGGFGFGSVPRRRRLVRGVTQHGSKTTTTKTVTTTAKTGEMSKNTRILYPFPLMDTAAVSAPYSACRHLANLYVHVNQMLQLRFQRSGPMTYALLRLTDVPSSPSISSSSLSAASSTGEVSENNRERTEEGEGGGEKRGESSLTERVKDSASNSATVGATALSTAGVGLGTTAAAAAATTQMGTSAGVLQQVLSNAAAVAGTVAPAVGSTAVLAGAVTTTAAAAATAVVGVSEDIASDGGHPAQMKEKSCVGSSNIGRGSGENAKLAATADLLTGKGIEWDLDALSLTSEILQHETADREPSAQFHVGQLVKHRKFGYRAVVVGFDQRPLMDVSNWEGVIGLPRGGDQPFYRVIPDKHDVEGFLGPGRVRNSYYVAQENLTPLCDILSHKDLQTTHIQHKDLPFFFRGYDFETCRFRPPSKLRYCFPVQKITPVLPHEMTVLFEEPQQDKGGDGVENILDKADELPAELMTTEAEMRVHRQIDVLLLQVLAKMDDFLCESKASYLHRTVDSTILRGIETDRKDIDTKNGLKTNTPISDETKTNGGKDEQKEVLKTFSSELLQVEDLLSLLQTAEVRTHAQHIEPLIWTLWMCHPNKGLYALMRIALALTKRGNGEEAEKLYRIAVDLDPSFADAQNKLAVMRHQRGDYPGCIQRANKALESFPHHYAALAGVALSYERSGEKDLAADSLREALALNPWANRLPSILLSLLEQLHLESTPPN